VVIVANKGNKQWIWLALDVQTREIVGVYVAIVLHTVQRTIEEDGAQGLWESLPAVYRQCAVAYTNFWSAYKEIFPSKRHQSVSKDSGKTSYIVHVSAAKQNGFNCTLRQRVSRLERKTLSFSKKLKNHIGAI
jgi:IS1 family transposase